MTGPKKKPPSMWDRVERLVILVSAIGMAGYLIIDGTRKDEFDRIYVIGLLIIVIGYFAKELTGQKYDNTETPGPRDRDEEAR